MLALPDVKPFDDQGGRHGVRHRNQRGDRRLETCRAPKFETQPLNDRQHVKARRASRLQDVRKGQLDCRYQGAIPGQTHRRLDLDPRQARRFGARKDTRQVLFEGLFDFATTGATIDPREATVGCEPGKWGRQHISRQRRQLGEIFCDGDVRHVASTTAQGVALVSLMQDLSKPALG